jgi:acylphosphatase
VQGVFFRDSVEEEARRRGVDGWVRNLLNGGVEAVFEGPPPAVEALVGFCREGPRFSRVEALEVAEEEPESLRGFRILR